MKTLAILPVALAAAILGSGCVSLSTLQSARAAPEGQLRSAVGVTMLTSSPPGTTNTELFVPVPEVALRYGLGNGKDVGIKAGPLGSQVEFKAELLNRPQAIISVAPAAGIFYVSNFAGTSSSITNLALHLPLLVGLELNGGHEFLFGPRVSALMLWQSAGTTSQNNNALLMGGFLAVGLKVSESVRVQPEISLATKIAGDGPNGGSGFQFGVGFLFGK